MIKSAISSAAHLSLAPARLAGRLVGSLVSGLRGSAASPTTTRRREPTHAGSRSRSRTRTQAKRRASSSRAKAQPKRVAAGSRAKAQPKRVAAGSRAKAQAKRTTSRTRASAQPERTAPRPGAAARAHAKDTSRRKPLDDITIARKVESIIFRGVDVDKGAVDVNVAGGVLWLRGEVPTADLISVLETRANDVTEVRRVENLLHVPASPAATRPNSPAEPAQTPRAAAGREDHVATPEETPAETPTPALPRTHLGTPGPGGAGAALGEGAAHRTADQDAEDNGTTEKADPEQTPSDEHPA
jgi:osmotically-inducible protein OsmY